MYRGKWRARINQKVLSQTFVASVHIFLLSLFLVQNVLRIENSLRHLGLGSVYKIAMGALNATHIKWLSKEERSLVPTQSFY